MQVKLRENLWDSIIVKLLGRKISLPILKIRRTLKVDTNTSQVAREKFARLCVEVDLEKPLVSQYLTNGILYLVEYEGLPQVYFKCKCVEHEREACPELKRTEIELQSVNGGDKVAEKDRDKTVISQKEKSKKVIEEPIDPYRP
ncbi:hypothetical protein Ahy_B07g087653 [Arachis hypogaea]|uniref:Zinc knuckle CX2CX4HX4C domain-containing protein n=1 Tax=Arachis hypogaea TaxID=3818 RepID=A0A444YCM8_ARAHY|nr:hypothetical protein Ahy_B07g087653 [Arachis hypogaea]